MRSILQTIRTVNRCISLKVREIFANIRKAFVLGQPALMPARSSSTWTRRDPRELPRNMRR